MRHGRSCLVVVDRYAHQFRTGAGEGGHLLHCRRNIGRVGIGHGLHHDWCIRPHTHTANNGGDGLSALNIGHKGTSILSRRIRLPEVFGWRSALAPRFRLPKDSLAFAAEIPQRLKASFLPPYSRSAESAAPPTISLSSKSR